jgi:6-phospho-beta-glucosidase
LPIIITENGLGARDTLEENDTISDPDRIDYLRQHIAAVHDAIQAGVDVIGYSPWSALDLISVHEGISKRYGFIYVDRDEHDERTMRRIPKESFYWYQNVIQNNSLPTEKSNEQARELVTE